MVNKVWLLEVIRLYMLNLSYVILNIYINWLLIPGPYKAFRIKVFILFLVYTFLIVPSVVY